MTSLRKHIIPLQKDKLKLAFNIQSYDTIKYTDSNISSEIDRAIKDASSAAHTGDLSEEFREIAQFVHDSLPGPFPPG